VYFKLIVGLTYSLDVRMRLLDGHTRKWAELNMDRLRVLLNKCVRPESDRLRHGLACSMLRVKKMEILSTQQII